MHPGLGMPKVDRTILISTIDDFDFDFVQYCTITMESGEISHNSVGVGDLTCLLRVLDEILEMEWGYGLLRIELLKMVGVMDLHKTCTNATSAGQQLATGPSVTGLRTCGSAVVAQLSTMP